jgi:hypothetical protein
MSKNILSSDYPSYAIKNIVDTVIIQEGGGPTGPTGPAGSGGGGSGEILFFSYPTGATILGTSGPTPSITGAFPTILPNGSKAIFNIGNVTPNTETFFFNVLPGHTAELIGTATYDNDPDVPNKMILVGANNTGIELTGNYYVYRGLFVNGTMSSFSQTQQGLIPI